MFIIVLFYLLFPLVLWSKKWMKLRPKQKKQNRKKVPYRSATPELLKKYSDIDLIVVGANMSGLVTAALLSKLGIKVLVIERKAHPGGQFRPEERSGVEFTRKVIEVDDVEAVGDILEVVSPGLWWKKRGLTERRCYETPSKKLEIQENSNQTRLKMQTTFIDEEAQKQLWKHVAKYSNSNRRMHEALKLYHMPQVLRDSLQELCCSNFVEYQKISLLGLFADCEITKNNQLREIFSNQMENSSSVVLDALSNEASHYPRDGAIKLINELCHTIRTNNSHILTDAVVTKIRPRNSTIEVNGIEINAQKIVSAVSLHQTFGLVGFKAPPMRLKPGKFYAFISLSDDANIVESHKIIVKDNRRYECIYQTKDSKRVTVVEEMSERITGSKKLQELSNQLLEISGCNPDHVKWVHLTFEENEHLEHHPSKMVRANKPWTQFTNLYITGGDVMHTDSFEDAVRAGYITANAVCNYGTPIDILFGLELIKNY
jgi:hypothetical protein